VTAEPAAARWRGVRALVTGGGGFIGQAVIDRLLAAGAHVRALGRREYPNLAERGVECVRGDIVDVSAVDRAVAGCEIVFHVAAKAGVWGAWEDYFAPNVLGTRHVIAASQKYGISRLVFTSSPSVVFDGRDQRGIDECAPYPTQRHSAYSATKALAEQAVLAAHKGPLRTVALRPHLVWGPGDNHIVPRLLAQARAGKLRVIGDGSAIVDTTFIDNAANAHIAAAEALAVRASVGGKPYFLSNGEPRPVWEIINGILAAGGLPPVTRHISRRAALVAATVLEATHRLFRRNGEPRLTRFVVEELSTSHWFDITAARRDLGYEPRVTIAEGMQRLAQHLRSK
jgi:nucleoside-diphosphate-sugar epimerase